MEFTNKIPEWKNEGTEPSESLQTEGFKGGYKPPAGIFNWFWSKVTKAITEIQTKLKNLKAGDINAVSKSGDTMTGTLTATKLIANGRSGIEGGQIEMATPATNTSLEGDIVSVDIYGNKFRIFGDNFGIDLDLTKCDSTRFYHSGDKPTLAELGASDSATHNVKTYSNFNQLGITDVTTLTSWVNVVPANSILATSIYYAISSPMYDNGLLPTSATGGLVIANTGSRCMAIYTTDDGDVYTGGSENLSGTNIKWKKPLPVTGGTMSGKIVSTIDGPIMSRKDNTGALRIDGGTDYAYGAFLALFGDEANNPGVFQLVATNSNLGQRKELKGYPDGGLTWDGCAIAKVRQGGYVGTGTCGEDNPNTLTFDFEPYLVIVKRSDNYHIEMTYVRYCSQSNSRDDGRDAYAVTISWENNSISWYGFDSTQQCNDSGVTYQYVAIG